VRISQCPMGVLAIVCLEICTKATIYAQATGFVRAITTACGTGHSLGFCESGH